MLRGEAFADQIDILAQEIELPDKVVAQSRVIDQLNRVTHLESDSSALPIENQQCNSIGTELSPTAAGRGEAQLVGAKEQTHRITDSKSEQQG